MQKDGSIRADAHCNVVCSETMGATQYPPEYTVENDKTEDARFTFLIYYFLTWTVKQKQQTLKLTATLVA